VGLQLVLVPLGLSRVDGGGLTLAIGIIVAFTVGWFARDLWNFAVEMIELYKEQR